MSVINVMTEQRRGRRIELSTQTSGTRGITMTTEPFEDVEFACNEPEEGDYTTPDHVHFYQYGRLAVSVPEGDSIRDALIAHMNAGSFFPSVWFISDHGNAIPMNLTDHA